MAYYQYLYSLAVDLEAALPGTLYVRSRPVDSIL